MQENTANNIEEKTSDRRERSRELSDSGRSKYLLVNAYDELVKQNVLELMAKMDMCQCEKCFLDVCAIVFNRQYTHFVTTKEGALLSKVPEMNHGNHVEMTVIILDAIRMVRDFPKHDK